MATMSGSQNRHSPIPKMVLGAAMLIIFMAAILLHVQTTEALFAGGKAAGLSPNWGLFLQIWSLIQGQLSPTDAETVIVGWGVEAIFLMCVVGYDVAHEHVRDGSETMARVFRTMMLAFVIFDAVADYQYSAANGPFGQGLFVGAIAFIIFFFGTVGWHYLSTGYVAFRTP